MATPAAPPARTPSAPAAPRAAPAQGHAASAGLAFARVLARTPARPAHAAPMLGAGRKLEPAARPGVPVQPELASPGHARVEGKHGRAPDDGDGEREHGARHVHHADDLLDPSVRQAAQLAPPTVAAPTPAAEAIEAPRARMSLEELLPQLVRRIAWAGDRNKGTVRMEIGAGAYAGATLLVHADAGRVRVEVSGIASDELRARIDQRLRRSGLDVESVT